MNAKYISIPTSARAVLAKVAKQVRDNEEARLMFSVFELAMRDAHITPTSREHADTAKQYLASEMVHLGLIGIEVEWVRRLMREAGVPIG